MEKNDPFFLIKTENYGTGSPFFARLLLFILQLRDLLLPSEEARLEFDRIYDRFFEPAKSAYLSFRSLVNTHNEYVEELISSHLISVQNNTISVDKTIDSDVRRLTNSILSEADIAFKGYINEFSTLFDGLHLGFMAQKEKDYQKGLENLRAMDSLLADYVDENRKTWERRLNKTRNEMVHGGWQLPQYQFGFNKEADRLEMYPPQIEGMMYLDFLGTILSGLFTFVEEMTVYLLSTQLRFQIVYQIPIENRKKENLARFALGYITDQYLDPWELIYTRPDYSLTE